MSSNTLNIMLKYLYRTQQLMLEPLTMMSVNYIGMLFPYLLESFIGIVILLVYNLFVLL